jgi:hypothetical protein
MSQFNLPASLLKPVTVTAPYCTDEDVAILAAGDFLNLVPHNQKMGYGTDGVFNSGSPWTLHSASVDPMALQMSVGMAVWLSAPTTTYKSPGDLLFIDAIAANQITLHRPSFLTGVGMPPGPPAGLTGVTFTVLTVLPQIVRISYNLDQRHAVDDLIYGRRHADQYDPRQLRHGTALNVLHSLYVGMARGAKDSDNWWAKAGEIKQQRDAWEQWASVTWRNSTAGTDRTGPFNTRIVRG